MHFTRCGLRVATVCWRWHSGGDPACYLCCSLNFLWLLELLVGLRVIGTEPVQGLHPSLNPGWVIPEPFEKQDQERQEIP
jgi:hypothetical protein